MPESPEHEPRVQTPPAARLEGLDPRTQVPQLSLLPLVFLREVVGAPHGNGL